LEGDATKLTFIFYIERMQKKMAKPAFKDPSVWVWMEASEGGATYAAKFAARIFLEYDVLQSIYRASRNKRLNNAKTRTPPATMYLLFLFKRADDRVVALQANVKDDYSVPNET